MTDTQALLSDIVAVAHEAGAAIMDVYATDFDVARKDDDSPVTEADLAAEALITPVLKRLTSVFSCTSTEVWMEGERFCQLPNTTAEGAQCMDNDPLTQCWGSTHLGYMLVVMALLPPYYLATLNLQLAAQVIAQRCCR